jgi:hypothetical protein
MTGDAQKRATRKWRQARSSHADVLHGLERAIASHPAGGRSITRRSAPTDVTRIPREKTTTSPDAA